MAAGAFADVRNEDTGTRGVSDRSLFELAATAVPRTTAPTTAHRAFIVFCPLPDPADNRPLSFYFYRFAKYTPDTTRLGALDANHFQRLE